MDLLGRLDFPDDRHTASCVEAGDKKSRITREHRLFLRGLCLMALEGWEEASGEFERVATDCPQSPNRSRAVFLVGQAEKGPGLSSRSPAAAAVFSAVVPGTGQMYSGRFRDGLRHLIFNGLLIYTVYWLARDDNYTGAYLVAGITLPFYVGNIVGAKRSAEWFNATKRSEFVGDSISATE
jgi:TM2 domain-containing membrane protein YozV